VLNVPPTQQTAPQPAILAPQDTPVPLSLPTPGMQQPQVVQQVASAQVPTVISDPVPQVDTPSRPVSLIFGDFHSNNFTFFQDDPPPLPDDNLDSFMKNGENSSNLDLFLSSKFVSLL
jgi:hypothetical protein